MSDKNRYRYVTNCTDGDHGPYGEAIHEMTDQAEIIDYSDLVRMVGINELEAVFPSYDWKKRPTGLTLKRDYHVSYYKSVWRGIPCVYVEHSRIEYIFTLNGQRPTGPYVPSEDDDE